jgi:hypothetical protein
MISSSQAISRMVTAATPAWASHSIYAGLTGLREGHVCDQCLAAPALWRDGSVVEWANEKAGKIKTQDKEQIGRRKRRSCRLEMRTNTVSRIMDRGGQKENAGGDVPPAFVLFGFRAERFA